MIPFWLPMRERLQEEVLVLRDLGSLFGLFEGIDSGAARVEVPERVRYLLRQNILHLPDSPLFSCGEECLFRFDGSEWVRSQVVKLSTTHEHPEIRPAQIGGAERIITLSCQEGLGSPKTVVVVAGSTEKPEIFSYKFPSKGLKGGFSQVGIKDISDFLNHKNYCLLVRCWQRLAIGDEFYTKMADFLSWVSAAELVRRLK